MKESIKHAAIRAKCGWIFIGKSHADCFHKADNINVELSSAAADHGFVTSNGRFVERPEAAKIAVAAGQLKTVVGGALHSEDLWSPEHGGNFVYNEIRGYTIV